MLLCSVGSNEVNITILSHNYCQVKVTENGGESVQYIAEVPGNYPKIITASLILSVL